MLHFICILLLCFHNLLLWISMKNPAKKNICYTSCDWWSDALIMYDPIFSCKCKSTHYSASIIFLQIQPESIIISFENSTSRTNYYPKEYNQDFIYISSKSKNRFYVLSWLNVLIVIKKSFLGCLTAASLIHSWRYNFFCDCVFSVQMM